MDDTWLGAHTRPLEHATGLQPVIEMGARQYHPILARFLEIDPIEAGTTNDYTYVRDPVNNQDVDGRFEPLDAANCLTSGAGPIVCAYANSIHREVSEITNTMQKRYGWSGDQSNAFRHAYWAARVAYRYNAEDAFQAVASHEIDHSHDTKVDLINGFLGAIEGEKWRYRGNGRAGLAEHIAVLTNIAFLDISGGGPRRLLSNGASRGGPRASGSGRGSSWPWSMRGSSFGGNALVVCRA
jgi:RHS repeat-associated protein